MPVRGRAHTRARSVPLHGCRSERCADRRDRAHSLQRVRSAAARDIPARASGVNQPMRIGELAQRLRVSTRTLRHYESVGLLTPASVDESTGYRSYGAAELLRGVRIEQLKGTGLSLEEIRAALDGDTSF